MAQSFVSRDRFPRWTRRGLVAEIDHKTLKQLYIFPSFLQLNTIPDPLYLREIEPLPLEQN